MIQPMRGPNAESEIRVHPEIPKDDPGEGGWQQRPEDLPDHHAPIDADGAEVTNDEQRQDKAGRFPRLDNHGKKKNGQNPQAGEATPC